MLRKLLVTVSVVAVLAGLGWLGHRYVYVPVSESMAKDNHSEAVFKYTHEVEPKIAEYAVKLADKHGALDGYERGAAHARLKSLKDNKGKLSLSLSVKDEDSYGKLLQEMIYKIQHKCVLNVEAKTGLNFNFDTRKLEWKTAMEEESKPFRDLFEMDKILSRLTWNAAGRMFDNMRESGKPSRYTMDRLAKDKAEFDELRPQLDALIAKNGI